MEVDDLLNRFEYHKPTGNKAEMHATVRRALHGVALDIDAVAPDCREKSLAITALEEAMMWANAAIARHEEVPGWIRGVEGT